MGLQKTNNGGHDLPRRDERLARFITQPSGAQLQLTSVTVMFGFGVLRGKHSVQTSAVLEAENTSLSKSGLGVRIVADLSHNGVGAFSFLCCSV